MGNWGKSQPEAQKINFQIFPKVRSCSCEICQREPFNWELYAGNVMKRRRKKERKLCIIFDQSDPDPPASPRILRRRALAINYSGLMERGWWSVGWSDGADFQSTPAECKFIENCRAKTISNWRLSRSPAFLQPSEAHKSQCPHKYATRVARGFCCSTFIAQIGRTALQVSDVVC